MLVKAAVVDVFTVCHTDAWCLPLFPPRPSGSMRAPSLCVEQLILAVEFEVLEVR